MPDRVTAVVTSPEVDAVVAGALAGRAAAGRVEPFVCDSQELVGFFRPEVQRRLPRGYDLVLCGLEVEHTDWDGRLVRPHLMDALRAFLGQIRWFSIGRWEPEDQSAVAHIIGSASLTILETSPSVARLVRDALLAPGADYETRLVEVAEGRAGAEWAQVRPALAALKGDRDELCRAAGLLVEQRVPELLATYGPRAADVDRENRRAAGEHAEECVPMGGRSVVPLCLPADRHPFWAEVSACAREQTGAELSLCHLEGRSVLLLACDPDVRLDLRLCARYVTDLLPGARSIGARREVVPLVVPGLAGDHALRDQVIALMRDGAHLLKG